MSDTHGPVTSPEQPEQAQPVPAQSAPAQPTAPAAPPVAAAPPALPPTQAVPPAPVPQRGTGFTILVAGLTSLVVALVVAAGTAFAVARHVDDQPHRVMIGVEHSVPDGAQRPGMPGWSDQRPGRSADESGSTTDGQDNRRSSEQGSTDTESSGS